MGVTTYHSTTELSELFSMAGYSNIQIYVKYELDFICGIGTKPLSSPDKKIETSIERITPYEVPLKNSPKLTHTPNMSE